MNLMKAIRVEKPGEADVLQVSQVPLPELKDGWTLVKVLGFGINRSEIFTRKGWSPSVQFPRILGIECVGQVEQTTSPDLVAGQLVISFMGEMGRAFDGSYADYALLPDSQLYPVVSDLDLAALVALPETYYTAFGALKNLNISATDKVLVRGATSGVGQAFARLLKAQHPDIYLVGTSRDRAKEPLLLAEGYDEVFIDEDNQLQSSKSFTKILELIGPKTIKDSLCYLEEGGILCSCGQLGGQWYLDNFDPIEQLANNVYLTTFYSGNVSPQKVQELLDFVGKHEVKTSPERIFHGLEEVADAHRYLESQGSFGKVVVLLSEEVKEATHVDQTG
ncbi:NADPH:quinone reductase-like Zn-dependent oxidoreductase [Streptococcus rupicaprae]|uniref:NADPH:quinone reductase-like Zn-dependent oxidoreductase n=2 Tax=Streptococcus rupicaprae TaxID=759619 RepID=A0ABV2FHY9_9STRE